MCFPNNSDLISFVATANTIENSDEHETRELLNKSTVHIPQAVILASSTAKAVSFNDEKNDRDDARAEELAVH